MQVIVYSKPSCPQCDATYRLLNREGIEFESVDLSTDAGAFEMVQSLGHLQAPVVIATIDGETSHWAGFRPDRIKATAKQLARELVAA